MSSLAISYWILTFTAYIFPRSNCKISKIYKFFWIRKLNASESNIWCFDKCFSYFTGIFVIMLALCADAVIGNVQEKVMKQFNCSNIEMVSIKLFFYNNCFTLFSFMRILVNSLICRYDLFLKTIFHSIQSSKATHSRVTRCGCCPWMKVAELLGLETSYLSIGIQTQR